MRIVRVAVICVGIGLCLTGCTATPPLSVAGGIGFCIEDPTGGPVGLAIDSRNGGSSTITITRVTAGGSNITPGKPWLIPAHGTKANVIASLVTPFDSDPDWSGREVIGRGKIKPGQSIAIVATVSIPHGGLSGASIQGVDIDYTTADGSHHTVHSSVHAHFSSHC